MQCVEERGLNVEQVNACFTSTEGYQLMLNAEKETKAMTPGPLFVPTIVFNDVNDLFFFFLFYQIIFHISHPISFPSQEYNEDDQNEAFTNFESVLCKKLISRGYKDVCLNGVIVNPIIC